jgi:hypothetical protein
MEPKLQILDMPEQCVGLEMVLKLDIKNHQANLKQ